MRNYHAVSSISCTPENLALGAPNFYALIFRLDMLIPLRPRCEDTFQQAKMLPIFLICLSNSDQRSQDALICAETSAWLPCVSSCLNHFEPTPFGLTWSDKMLSRSHFSEGRCDRNHGNSHGQGIFKLFRTAQRLRHYIFVGKTGEHRFWPHLFPS